MVGWNSGAGEMPDFSQAFGPGQVDQMIRQAIGMCWMCLPPERKTIQDLEAEMRRLVDRALHDLNEDAQSFGIG